MSPHPFVGALQALASQRDDLGWLQDAGQRQAHETDWRQRFTAPALAVCEPTTVAGVQALMRLAHTHGVPVVAQGGNTSLVGGSVPLATEASLLLGLRRLCAVRQLDVVGKTLVAEAGLALQQAQAMLAPHGLEIPLDLGSRGSATLGGLLACNAGGMEVLRHGTARAQCLGLEVVLANGELLSDLRALRKNNTGPDLKQLFLGTEGSLGIITAAVWQLVPTAHNTATALMAVPNLATALDALAHLQAGVGPLLSRCEWMGSGALRLLQQVRPQDLPANLGGPTDGLLPTNDLLLIELASGSPGVSAADALEHALADLHDVLAPPHGLQGHAPQAWVAQSHTQAEDFWRIREGIPAASAQHGAQVKLDIALPLATLAEFYAMAIQHLERDAPGWRPVVFGHLGDGSLHFNVAPPADGPQTWDVVREKETQIAGLVYALVDRMGGSISAEHGLGQLKDHAAAERRSPTAQHIVAGLKQLLDPQDLLNRGRVLGLAGPRQAKGMPTARPPRVAVVGAGMAGLAAATAHAKAGHAVTIFEKSRGAAGRLSTRRGDGWRCDHGAVALAAQTPAFQEVLQAWMGQGLAAPWGMNGQSLVVGSPGMTAPLQTQAARLQAGGVALHLETQIRSLGQAAGVAGAAGGKTWLLHDDQGTGHGPFDLVVLAIPPLQAQALLDIPAPHMAQALAPAQKSMAPCWTAMLVLDEPLGPEVAGRLAQAQPSHDSPDFLRVVCNSSKPGRQASPEVWCLQASAAWSQAHLEIAADAAASALHALAEKRAGQRLPGQVAAHRWRFAFPFPSHAEPGQPTAAPTPGEGVDATLGYLFDAALGLGVAGDALGMALLPQPDPRALHGAEAAWLSGNALSVATLQHLGPASAQQTGCQSSV